MSGTEACARFVCILLIAASAIKPDRPRGSTSPRARTETTSDDRDSFISFLARRPLMTAVQNFTSLAEIRTTSVEENGVLCVKGRRHDIMHDAFDEIPPRDMFKISLPTTCFDRPRGSSNRPAESPMSMNQESWKCPKESTVFACVANAFHPNTTVIDLEPT